MAEDMQDLATRRPRRSTAGNRMEAALAEMALDEINKDLDDDNEFVNDKDEEDVFESDFASTDEEAAQEDTDAGEKAIHEEAKTARKAARSQLEKRTAAAHAKHKATFNPQAIAPSTVKLKPKTKPTTSFDAPESSTQDAPRRTSQKRKSQRRHTVLNTSATDSRVRETEEKKASAPKKFKPTVKTFSQAELIQRALDNEDGNINEHKNYLQVEEEKRKKARVIKMPVVEGPLLRWISKAEEEKFKVQVEVTPPAPQPSTTSTYPNYSTAQLNSYYAQLYHYLATQPGALSAVTAQVGLSPASSSTAAGQTLTSQLATASNTSSSAPTTTGTTVPSSTTAFSTFRLPNTTNPYPFTYYTPTTTGAAIPSTMAPPPFQPASTTAPSRPPQKQYVEEERIETVTKNYVVHEAGQREGIAKPPWKDMMKAMFGDHVKWEELKVLSGKGRPLARVKQRCPITGEIAPYLDPRTGVPFADVEAYKVLTDLLDHNYVWSPELGCYV